jgi:Flp pilus assembly protein TadG
MQPMRKLNEQGAVAAEFALLLPVLLTILFSIIEFGMIMYGREVVTNAAREGARFGIVATAPKPSAGAIESISNGYLTGTGVNAADVTFVATGAQTANPNPLIVTATYNYNWLIPYIPTMLGVPNPLVITITTTMIQE